MFRDGIRDLKSRFLRIIEVGHGQADDEALNTAVAKDYVLHCPDGTHKSVAEASASYATLRNAFDEFTVRCDHVLADGEFIAARTNIDGTFRRAIDLGMQGKIEPHGHSVHFETISIFRFDENGLLAEEWAQSDNQTLMARLGGPIGAAP